LKRTPISRKKTKQKTEFDRELDRMRPIIHERSRGKCEAFRIAQEAMSRAIDLFNEGVITQELADEICESATDEFISICTGRATHVHHRKYISRGGTNAENNLADLCSNHHRWTHRHGGFGESANLLRLALSAGEGGGTVF
jgi:hypothetical protein